MMCIVFRVPFLPSFALPLFLYSYSPLKSSQLPPLITCSNYIDQDKLAIYFNHGRIRALPFIGPTIFHRPFWLENQNGKGVIASASILTRRARDWEHDSPTLVSIRRLWLKFAATVGSWLCSWDNFEEIMLIIILLERSGHATSVALYK